MESEADAIAADEAMMKELGIDPAEAEPAEQPETTPEEAPVVPDTKEDDEDPEEPSDEDEKQVPTRKPNAFKEFKAELKAEFAHEREKLVSDYESKLEALRKESTKDKPDADKTQEQEDEIKELAKELNFDEAKTRRLIEVARKGVETLSTEDREALKEYRESKQTREQERESREQDEIFATEWSALLPSIKQQYPNASDEQLAAAKEKMDELSHSEKFHETDLDYVFFKNPDAFKTVLFSPKQKTFESGRPAPEESDELPEFDPSMTPAQFERWEKRQQAIMDSSPQQKVRINTRDDMGHIVERWE